MLKNYILFIVVLCFFKSFSQKNVFIGRDFWKTNPTIAEIDKKIKEGNSASALNRFGFDAVVYSLLENATPETTLYLLSKEGNDVNKLTHDGRTYIFWAAYKNNSTIVKYLLENGAKTDILDDKGYSLMNFTAIGGVQNTDLYDLFIENGADVLKQKTPKGANPLLLIASSLDDFKMIDYFTSKGLSINDTDNDGNGIFNYTALKENRKMLELLINKGVPYKQLNRNSGNAMLFATRGSRRGYNSLDYFKYLESLGISPNTVNKKGENPLHNLASSNKDLNTFNYFINKGGNVNQADMKGNTPLLLATKRNSLETVSLLLKNSTDINYTNKKGYSALTNALQNETTVVEFLLSKGADATVIDAKGNNLIYHLFKSFTPKQLDGFNKKLTLLNNNGLPITSTQKDGTTPYHIAVQKNSIELLDIIKNHDIDINLKNKKGLTALQLAVMTAKDHKIIKQLIKYGATKNVTTDFNETLYDLAKENEALTNTDISYLQ